MVLKTIQQQRSSPLALQKQYAARTPEINVSYGIEAPNPASSLMSELTPATGPNQQTRNAQDIRGIQQTLRYIDDGRVTW